METKFVFRIQKKSKRTRRNPRRDTGRSSVLETKKCKNKPEAKWNSIVSQMVQVPVHFNTDASNTDLLFRLIHFVNQLSIYGAVSNWYEQFGLIADEKGQERILEKEILKSMNSQEVNSLVSSAASQS